MSNIEYSTNIDFSQAPISIAEIEAILPNWKTQINEIYQFEKSKLVQVDFIVAAKTEAEISQWLVEYADKTKASYSIRSTEKCSGYKVRFKQRLNCQHNTGNPKLYKQSESKRTRNTNCPANITVTLRKVGKRYQGKDQSKAPNPEMPCEMRIIPFHNHSTESADLLRLRQVSPQTRDKLTKLFEAGHSPFTALQTIKYEIHLNYDNYSDILGDRSMCPDYMYTYHLYSLIYKRKYKAIEASQEFLQEKVDAFNTENDCNSARIQFVDDDYVICLCTPLMQRVHETIEEASEVVYIISNSVSEQKVTKQKLSSDQNVSLDDKITIEQDIPLEQESNIKDDTSNQNNVDQKSNHIYVLLTSTDCGGLPLAIFITSSDCCHLISAGFQMLKEFLGNKIFYGAADGPAVFMIDDSAADQAAINSEWPNSTVLLSSFHVLQSIWMWLIKAKNEVYLDHVHDLYQQFKNIMFASTVEECAAAYRVAQKESEKYPQYRKCLKQFWNRRPLWALCYKNYLNRGSDTNNLAEAAMRLLTDKIFDTIKSFNLLQTIDFMMTQFTRCFEKRLLEVALNQAGQGVLQRLIPKPTEETINGIENFSENTHLVPCEKDNNLLYIVNTEILICTCTKGRTGNMCKHIWWVCGFVFAEKFIKSIDDESLKIKYFYIATGEQSEMGWYEGLFEESQKTAPIEQHLLKIELQPAETATEIPNLTDIPVEMTEPDEKLEAVVMGENEGRFIVKGSDVINEITERFCDFLTQSPVQVCQALETFNAHLKEIKTPTEFVTGCLGFSLATSANELPMANLSEKRNNTSNQTSIKKKRKSHITP